MYADATYAELLVESTAPSVADGALTLEGLYREHFDFVYRKAASLGGPGFDAEDAAQEVFLIASRRLHTFDGSSRVTTWLYGITLNVVRASRRRARVRRLFELRHPEHERAESGPDRVEVQQARAIAYAILDKLSAEHRETFILTEFEGLTGQEIAALMGCKVETVWSRLHYARKEFARRLAARGFRPRDEAGAGQRERGEQGNQGEQAQARAARGGGGAWKDGGR